MEMDDKSLPVSTGFDEFDVDAIINGSSSILHLEGCVLHFVDQQRDSSSDWRDTVHSVVIAWCILKFSIVPRSLGQILVPPKFSLKNAAQCLLGLFAAAGA